VLVVLLPRSDVRLVLSLFGVVECGRGRRSYSALLFFFVVVAVEVVVECEVRSQRHRHLAVPRWTVRSPQWRRDMRRRGRRDRPPIGLAGSLRRRRLRRLGTLRGEEEKVRPEVQRFKRRRHIDFGTQIGRLRRHRPESEAVLLHQTVVVGPPSLREEEVDSKGREGGDRRTRRRRRLTFSPEEIPAPTEQSRAEDLGRTGRDRVRLGHDRRRDEVEEQEMQRVALGDETYAAHWGTEASV